MLSQNDFSNDLNTIFDDWDAAVYNLSAIQGMFRFDYIEINGVISNRPTFLCKTSDVPTPANGDDLTLTTCVLNSLLDSTVYKVREYQRNGNDTTLLILESV